MYSKGKKRKEKPKQPNPICPTFQPLCRQLVIIHITCVTKQPNNAETHIQTQNLPL